VLLLERWTEPLAESNCYLLGEAGRAVVIDPNDPRGPLERLEALGVPCGIATASEAFQARSAMERLGLWPHFRFAVSCVQYGGKTRPDIYLEAARRLGTAPAETVVFEDALHAARTAHEAGFRVCGVWDASAEEDQAALKALADWYVRDLGDWVP